MAKSKSKDFIQKAVPDSRKGVFSAKAKAHHMSTQAYARQEENAGGTLGKEAVLALTLHRLAQRKHGKRRVLGR